MKTPDGNPNAPKTTPTGVRREDYPLRSSTTDFSYNRSEADMLAEREWEWMLDNGLTLNKNPPPSPEVVANREATDRLFRSLPHNRSRLW